MLNKDTNFLPIKIHLFIMKLLANQVILITEIVNSKTITCQVLQLKR